MAANAGATTLDLQRHCGWRSEKTAIKYTENTKDRKRNICEKITGVKKGTKTDSMSQSNDSSRSSQSNNAKIHEKLIDTATEEFDQTITDQSNSEQTSEIPEKTIETPIHLTKNKKDDGRKSGDKSVTAASPMTTNGGQNVFHFQLSAGSNLTLNFS